MFFKRNKLEVVLPSRYTDYSERFAELEKIKENERYATKKTVVAASVIPAVASLGLVTHRFLTGTTTTTTPLPLYSTAISTEPTITTLTTSPTVIPVNTTLPQNTGIIADASLELLANVLDPVIQILVAISFPIASVIMVGACFFFMIGNTEKAWSMIMNAGLGYVLIQLSPLFLEILRQVGEAV